MLKSSRCFLLGGITISATVGAALKKIAVIILTNKKVMKKVLIVVVSLIMTMLLPVIAVISVLQGNINIDYNKLQESRTCPGRQGERVPVMINLLVLMQPRINPNML